MRRLETLLMLQKTGKYQFSEYWFSVLQTIEPFPLNPYYVERLGYLFVGLQGPMP